MKTENRIGAVALACALVSFEHLAEADLKAQYLLCARVSSQRVLSMEEAAGCSMVGEVLKMRSFSGDFDALIAWWRLHRDEQAADVTGRSLH